ncbi:MAG: MAPEG family protein [Paracoccaceae bacterium]
METPLPVTVIFVGLFVLMSVPMAIAVGLRRAQTGIMILHGDDADLLKRIRAHGNFVEYVPLALLALAAAEFAGAAAWFLIGVGCILLIARILHYASLRGSGKGIARVLGAALTSASMLVLALAALGLGSGLI